MCRSTSFQIELQVEIWYGFHFSSGFISLQLRKNSFLDGFLEFLESVSCISALQLELGGSNKLTMNKIFFQFEKPLV